MGDYARAAKYYDILYAQKDYAAEARLVADLIRARLPDARSILDVGCGTGAHAKELTTLGFEADGLDLEPEFILIAQGKCPDAAFHVADMRSFELGRTYDAVVSLFSAIGYTADEAGMRATVECMARHVSPRGMVIVEPWFEPGALTDGWITTVLGKDESATVCRMSRTVVDGLVSRLEFEYLVGTSQGIERMSETHALGLFTQSQMEGAFEDAGLKVTRVDGALKARGMYIGTPAPTLAR